MNHVELGKMGEAFAANLLRDKGYSIIHRNYKSVIGEIDIIASRGARLSFVEVKTRRNDKYGNPCEAVDDKKAAKIRAAAEIYLNDMAKKGYIPGIISFDVIEVSLNHIKDAY